MTESIISSDKELSIVDLIDFNGWKDLSVEMGKTFVYLSIGLGIWQWIISRPINDVTELVLTSLLFSFIVLPFFVALHLSNDNALDYLVKGGSYKRASKVCVSLILFSIVPAAVTVLLSSLLGGPFGGPAGYVFLFILFSLLIPGVIGFTSLYYMIVNDNFWEAGIVIFALILLAILLWKAGVLPIP